LYTLTNPPTGMDPEAVDHVLGTLEPALPQVIASLERGEEASEVEEFLLDYVATLASRHPIHFAAVVKEHQARVGGDPIQGDALQMARLHGLQNSLELVRNWHWRVVDNPPDAERLVLNDLGFSYVGQQARLGRGLVVPLSPRVALLGFLGDKRGFASRLVATPMTIHWLNCATWSEATRETYAHPDDTALLCSLVEPAEVRVNTRGPYRGTLRNLLDE
jgi:hypothetical protein